MRPPLVSIVTPVYNGANYIVETVDSVLAQDFPGLEYLVVDDGSTDDTLDRLEPYQGRIRIIRQENRGEAAAVNAGVAAAGGEIIGIVNADDPLIPGLVSAALARLGAEPGLVGVYPDWLRIDAEGRVIGEVKVREYDYHLLLAQHFCIIGPGCLFRRTALRGAPPRDPRFRYTGDYHQWLRMGLAGRFARIPQTLATWRHHEGGASQARRDLEMAANNVDAVRDVLDRPGLPASVLALRGEALASAYYVASVLGLHNAAIPSRRYMIESLRYCWRYPPDFIPETRRSWRLVVFALGLPLTRPLAALYQRALPHRFRPLAVGAHYREWRSPGAVSTP
jgi:glycosyltransferase involved in cell wall biosynthesis